MLVEAIKTHRIECGENLEKIIDTYVKNINEQTILVITSKIISICQGRTVKKDSITKEELIQQEADLVIKSNNIYGIHLTIKNNILIPSAGIDESNGDNVYILYPENVQAVAKSIWNYLRNKHQLKNLGILITDSHTTPMRRGVTGIALGWCGFYPLHSYIGKPDLYGHPLRVTQINILDSLATSAVFLMGEGSEQTPIAKILNAPKIEFVDRQPTTEEIESIIISPEEDLYAPIFI
ncbi:MAG: putative folate metabolism gamma-glutamate ligase [Proteobacteria bacterium]|nr:putative folate metabolism gamma-glutamate ligase [Pseudomonadota bacterium]